jgi:hypothetical protein
MISLLYNCSGSLGSLYRKYKWFRRIIESYQKWSFKLKFIPLIKKFEIIFLRSGSQFIRECIRWYHFVYNSTVRKSLLSVTQNFYYYLYFTATCKIHGPPSLFCSEDEIFSYAVIRTRIFFLLNPGRNYNKNIRVTSQVI